VLLEQDHHGLQGRCPYSDHERGDSRAQREGQKVLQVRRIRPHGLLFMGWCKGCYVPLPRGKPLRWDLLCEKCALGDEVEGNISIPAGAIVNS